MASSDLFTLSPIQGVDLFQYTIRYNDFNPLTENKLPIGKQIEDQLAQSLHSDERYTLLAKGLQIQDNGITIGELDYIIQDHLEDLVFHLELVHKFYVYDDLPGEKGLSRWIGPNYKDKLEYKLEKLRKHQFPLLFHPCTRVYLDNLGLSSSSIQQKLCFKAELYVPTLDVQKQDAAINPLAIQGRYLYFDQVEETMKPDQLYHLCQKREWIQDEFTCDHWIDGAACSALLEEKALRGLAHMLWIKQGSNIERIFVLRRP